MKEIIRAYGGRLAGKVCLWHAILIIIFKVFKSSVYILPCRDVLFLQVIPCSPIAKYLFTKKLITILRRVTTKSIPMYSQFLVFATSLCQKSLVVFLCLNIEYCNAIQMTFLFIALTSQFWFKCVARSSCWNGGEVSM
jgi:hypothetical protein